MPVIHKSLETQEKLAILAQDSQYDLACSCGTQEADHRRRSKDNHWIYPVTLPNGRTTYLFKTLLSNVCVNNCRYCPLRVSRDPRRCTLGPEELVDIFLRYYRAGKVRGLFLSSGIIGTPDRTMEQINKTAALLRKKDFRGYIHLKIIPGAADAAIAETVSLASAVSVNIEVPGEKNFRSLCTSKNYQEDVIRPMKLISRLTEQGTPYSYVKQTTQFVVGASQETDREIVRYSWGLYKRLGLNRVYFSAYQRGLGDPDIPGEISLQTNAELLTREHRLYQVDWLIRKYGFSLEEIPFEQNGNLSLFNDPKEVWATRHPEFFPIDINKAGAYELMRVPGLGRVSVNFILNFRKNSRSIRSLEDLGRLGKRLNKSIPYLKFY